MTEGRVSEQVVWVRLLALLLALLVWVAVFLEGPGEARLKIAVVPEHLPTGLRLATAAPASVEVTVLGPRILLILPRLHSGACRIDLSGARAGTADYGTAEAGFALDRELKVVRIRPATLRLTLTEAQGAR